MRKVEEALVSIHTVWYITEHRNPKAHYSDIELAAVEFAKNKLGPIGSYQLSNTLDGYKTIIVFDYEYDD